MYKIFLLIMLFTSVANVYSQTDSLRADTLINNTDYVSQELKGTVLDNNSQAALPYTNIYVLHKNIGAISNEKGVFSINISQLAKSDTLRFQYIGYRTKKITIAELQMSPDVLLNEEIFNLSETIIFGNKLNAKSIVKNVLKNKDSNYRTAISVKQAFIRERYISDIKDIKLAYKKSSFGKLDRKMLKVLEQKLPKHSTSYIDFLVNIYLSNIEDDSIKFKIDPIQTVSLKEKDIAELEQIATIFENIFKDTDNEEYWKIKSGILSQKIDLDDDEVNTNSEDEKPKSDSLKENEKRTKHFGNRTKHKLKYATLDNDNDWEFLHKTGKYNYDIAGGTRVNGEDVYIIDFTPKSGGEFTGRLYISMETYALIRADYEYAPEKTGTDFNMFGVGYTENMYSGSIYFEKHDGNYRLKYFSKRQGSFATFDRNIALLKKRKRFLFDKKLKEIKIGVEISLNSEQSVEVLILDDKQITHQQFIDFNQPKKMEVTYVDQFEDKLWKGFSIIEPTNQMREYKKQNK